MNKNILLHTCCAPCASASSRRLTDQGYAPVLFFANSNIFPHEEFEKRLDAAKRLSEILNIPLISSPWEHEAWLEQVMPWADEPEGGKRCEICFHWNLSSSAQKAAELGIQEFTTSLTISPHKSSEAVFAAGRAFDGFREFNFKKQNGFAESTRLSMAFGLYRQDYCGCEFSIPHRRFSP